jgi:hypothetical protein
VCPFYKAVVSSLVATVTPPNLFGDNAVNFSTLEISATDRSAHRAHMVLKSSTSKDFLLALLNTISNHYLIPFRAIGVEVVLRRLSFRLIPLCLVSDDRTQFDTVCNELWDMKV